jgi:hypothetical protein
MLAMPSVIDVIILAKAKTISWITSDPSLPILEQQKGQGQPKKPIHDNVKERSFHIFLK